ncbi:MAG TPA: hypothetical protein GYA10_07440 [Alphaproteobacteria bacterium]|nr:hypothetical protein [Alphaproteobacteria bacterium]
MKKLLVSVLVLGLGASTAAMAQAASDFATVDADQSGDVTLTEAQAVWADLTQEAYAAADANSDGKVDQAEYEAFLAANPPA